MHKITKDAMTLLIFSAVAGIASYLYFFAMARMLSVEDYGLLASINSLMYILTIPQETIRTVVSVFIAKFRIKNEKGKMHWLMSSYLKRMFLLSGILFVIFLAISPLIAMLIHTTFSILVATSLSLVFAFVLPVMWGIFQGFEKFKAMGINDSIFNVAKLVAAMVIVVMLPANMKIYGALLSVPISTGLAFILGYWYFKDLRKAKKQKSEEKTTKYSLATLLIFGLVTLMYSVDVIIARYYFTPRMAGVYGGISTIGKALFFIATGIKRVMVPNLAGEHEKNHKKESMNILKKAGGLIAALFGGAFILSLFFSEEFVKIVLGSKYLIAAPYLKYMILAMALFSFANLLVYYNLVTNKNKKITFRILLTAAFLQIALLIFFHQNIMQFIWVLIVLNALLLISLFVVSLVQHKEREPLALLGSINIFHKEQKPESKKKNLRKERYKKRFLLKKK
jgi:O-antigen/teichoic acid export membrane protein